MSQLKRCGLPSVVASAALTVASLMLSTRYAIADVYMTEQSDGTPHFSDSPIDKSSQLLDSAHATRFRSASKGITRDATPGLQSIVEVVASKYGLDPALVRAVIDVESHFNPEAQSKKGALGLMQLMPQTAARYGVRDAFDAYQNIDAGARHLKTLLEACHGNVALALAAYNAGQRSIASHGMRIPPYGETMIYVPKVLARYEAYRAIARQGVHTDE